MQGQLGQAEFFLEEALGIYQEIGDVQGEADAHGYLGLVGQMEGQFDTAQIMYGMSLALNERLENLGKQAEDSGNLGNLYLVQGELKQAEAMLKRSLDLYEEIGDQRYRKPVSQPRQFIPGKGGLAYGYWLF
jgi:tetratricopeptide (TPR) repeat protein